MDESIILIVAEPGKDAEGYLKLNIIRENEVFGEVGDPKRAQRDSAMRSGYQATLKAKVNLIEYDGENYLRHNNHLYEIKETYKLDAQYLELTCSDTRCNRGAI